MLLFFLINQSIQYDYNKTQPYKYVSKNKEFTFRNSPFQIQRSGPFSDALFVPSVTLQPPHVERTYTTAAARSPGAMLSCAGTAR